MVRAELSKQKLSNNSLKMVLALDDRCAHGQLQSASGTSLSGFGQLSGYTMRNTPIQFASSTDTSILPIVTSQGNKFRARNVKLEEARVFSFSLILHPCVLTKYAICRNIDVSSYDF